MKKEVKNGKMGEIARYSAIGVASHCYTCDFQSIGSWELENILFGFSVSGWLTRLPATKIVAGFFCIYQCICLGIYHGIWQLIFLPNFGKL